MKVKLPVRVGLMDDDFFALKWIADLLTRDFRTTVAFETETPGELLTQLKRYDVDIVLLDVEYQPQEPELSELMCLIQSVNAPPAIVCFSQFDKAKTLRTAIYHGARGFLLKQEVRMAISSALVMASQVNFLITPGVLSVMRQEYQRIIGRVTSINAWRPHPGLTPQLRQVFTLKVLYGMSAPLTAQEIHLAPSTVEKYMQYAYQKLSSRWGDDRFLVGLDLNDCAPEIQAFHRFTLPPLEKIW